MALTPGTCVGPYEILSALGAGGMGEVYRARDRKLDRDVAIKILPDAFVSDPERVARFQREAKTLASLNHPNIGGIYGLEERGGVTALVMELVEGEDLSQRIARGAIPIDEALPIAKQIAEALETAHEQGIIHRDLKPANIKVRTDGTVKVLDFGLAKAMDPVSGVPNVSQSPTITTPAMMTGVGMILGTAAYMSPEQAKGREADKRSDVWAFGAVLYEMLTGTRAFDGEDMIDVLSAVARLEPNWEALSSDVPAPIRTLLQSCLVKDRRHRVGDISTALFVLDKAASLAPRLGTASFVPLPRRRLWRRALPVSAGVFLGSLITVLAVTYVRVAPVPPPEIRLEITTPPGQLSFSRLSPDGRQIVFSTSAAEGKPSQLWLRKLESETAQPLVGTEYAEFPFWAPDSRALGFIAAGRLMRIDLAGGSARSLANASPLAGAWGPDGTILFSPTLTSPLSRVPAAGGPQVEVTRFSNPAEASHRFPDFLPDGRHFLFFVAGTANVQGVYLGSLDTGDTRRLLESDSAAVFVAPDYVLFRRQENLLAQRLDPKTFETAGDSFSVADQVSGVETSQGEAAVSTSRAGSIAYRAPIRDPRQLTWFDRAGRQMGTLGDVDTSDPSASAPRISPDGRTVAVVRRIDGNRDVWLIEAARGVLRRFTSDPAAENYPVWAPDSGRLAFVSRRSGPQNLWFKRLDGGTEERLRESAENEVPTDWSPDGRFTLFTRGLVDVWAVPLEGGGTPVAVATTSFIEANGRFSPDGRRVAYQSNESRRNEIYVVPFSSPGVPTQVSTNGGVTPQWREDGREIFYRGPDNRLMAVPVVPQPNGRLDAGTPTALFTIPQGATYDVARDGQRILIYKPVGQAKTPPITVILNWKPLR